VLLVWGTLCVYLFTVSPLKYYSVSGILPLKYNHPTSRFIFIFNLVNETKFNATENRPEKKMAEVQKCELLLAKQIFLEVLSFHHNFLPLSFYNDAHTNRSTPSNGKMLPPLVIPFHLRSETTHSNISTLSNEETASL